MIPKEFKTFSWFLILFFWVEPLIDFWELFKFYIYVLKDMYAAWEPEETFVTFASLLEFVELLSDSHDYGASIFSAFMPLHLLLYLLSVIPSFPF